MSLAVAPQAPFQVRRLHVLEPDLVWTRHARARCEERGVTSEAVRATLDRPFVVMADDSGAYVAVAGVPSGPRYRMVAVVVKAKGSRWVVVTVLCPKRIAGGRRFRAVSPEEFAEVREHAATAEPAPVRQSSLPVVA